MPDQTINPADPQGTVTPAAPGGGANAPLVPKKPKTEAQKARERERRKRRRQNKQKKLSYQPGEDVPRLLGSNEGEAKLEQPPADLPSGQIVEQNGPIIADEITVPTAPSEQEQFADDDSRQVFEEGVAAESTATEEEGVAAESSATEEEGVAAESTATEEETVVQESTFAGQEPPVSIAPEDEEYLNRKKREEAVQLASALQQEEDVLEEVPQKQGLLGKLFNFLERTAEKRRQKKEALRDVPPLQEPVSQTGATLEALNVDQSEQGKGAFPVLLLKILKLFLRLAIVAAVAIGAFWIGSSLKVMDYLGQFWKPAPPGLELYVATPGSAITDINMQTKWGFETARLAGSNQGNAADLTYNVFFNANYFGHLKDPMSVTETGISAALYYGFGRNDEYLRNKFIFYVKFLAGLRNSNRVKVGDLLDGEVRRDLALDKFISETQELFDEGNTYRKEIAAQVDELKISVNSLTPDKERYETDFFAALDATSAEKADTLIATFVEVSQKQVELKAKLAALTQLLTYYEDSLIEMKTRLEAVKKNREALISGVAVTETPGVDLGLIRE